MDAANGMGAVEYPESDEKGDPYVPTVIAELLRPMIDLPLRGEIARLRART